ncbi:LAMI_0G16534g1_1 [Lachancea mirantina]|uniref:non-specific serine/threonine protein kinase n=1 Tax=Lachancea mirantina TaxID=1230905 RepID=A0A1G4KCT3_9SACH|nr:LAMI_0G16534g1_1 [Lachancea mirantina]
MYTNLVKLQTGTFSTVYWAQHAESLQEVALKVITKPGTGDTADRGVDPSAVHKELRNEQMAILVQNELDILWSLGQSHPNICGLLDFGKSRHHWLFVMEYAANGDLYELIRKLWLKHENGGHGGCHVTGGVNDNRCQVLSYGSDAAATDGVPEEVCSLDLVEAVSQLCGAISYAHKLGIAHRDIKPENVLVDKNGVFKLADWGLSVKQSVSRDHGIGTEKYLAPEAHSEGYDTFAADLWSLGITLLYVMFGVCPFRRAVPSDPNFARYCQNPRKFMIEYYFKDTKKNPGQIRSPWIHLPLGAYASRDHYLMHMLLCIVNCLLSLDPLQRHMGWFLASLGANHNEGSVEYSPRGSHSDNRHNSIASVTSVDSEESIFSNGSAMSTRTTPPRVNTRRPRSNSDSASVTQDFFHSGIVMNPDAVACLYDQKRGANLASVADQVLRQELALEPNS